MSSAKSCRIYEGNAVRQVTGDSIRPGGFQLTDRAMEHCALPPGARVLDIGCGTGATVEYLRSKYHLQAVGVDPSELLLEKGRQRSPNLPLLQAVGENLPFGSGEMDGIFAECSLSVTDHPQIVLQECCRVLRKDGILIVTDIYARNPEATAELRTLPLVSCITGALGREQLEDMLALAGFKIVIWEDHSELLKELVVKLILTHGSMSNFWQQADSETFDGNGIQETIKKAKPGYYLLIAQREGR